jgi:hypothetical protein
MKINKKPFFLIGVYLCLSVVLLFSVSCAEMARDMGIDGATDVQLRSGLTGTQNNPASLDPFKRYDLVMTANESRFFTMKVPSGWYWKVYVTAASRKENAEGRLAADISQPDPPWSPLEGTSFDKTMVLKNDGDQALLAVGNTVQTRYAVLRLSQEGAPVYVTIESQVSTTTNLLGPNPSNSDLKGLSQ